MTWLRLPAIFLFVVMPQAHRPALAAPAGLFFACLAFGWVHWAGTAGYAADTAAGSKGSPFLPAAGTADAANAPSETIEFAAVRTIGKQTDINLYDTQGKKNHWIPLGGTADGMSILSYDTRRDQVMAKIGGVNKLLTLRQPRGVIAGTAAIAVPPVASFATPSLPSAEIAPGPVAADSSPPMPRPPGPDSPESTSAAPTAPASPAAPLSVARQEEEARMLVSDLLEIGMAQRKAYEEKQRQVFDPNAAAQPAPAPAPNGPPSGG